MLPGGHGSDGWGSLFELVDAATDTSGEPSEGCSVDVAIGIAVDVAIAVDIATVGIAVDVAIDIAVDVAIAVVTDPHDPSCFCVAAVKKR